MTETTNHARFRTWKRRAAALLCLAVLLVLPSPWFIANTPLRNLVIQRVAAQDGLRVTAQSADFSWWSPLRLRGVEVAGDAPQMLMRIKEIHLEKSWLATWFRLPALGHVAVDAPQVEFVLASRPLEAPPGRPSKPVTGTFVAQQIEFRAVLPDHSDPVIELDKFDVVSHIEATAAGRFLSIEPVRILEKTTLSEGLCDHGLQLVAPLLAKTTAVRGAASLELTAFRVPLDGNDAGLAGEAAEVCGKLQLHHVSAKLKDSVFRDTALLASRLLRVDVPEEVRIADDTEVAFHLRDGRVYHDGLTFLLPDVSSEMVCKTRGSVGLDETLDLTVEIRLPVVPQAQSELIGRLTGKPLTFHVAGTVDDPKLQLSKDGDWLNEAAQTILGEGLPGEGQTLSETMRDILKQMKNRRESRLESGAPPVLDWIREQFQNRREQREETAPGRRRRLRNPGRERPGNEAESDARSGV